MSGGSLDRFLDILSRIFAMLIRNFLLSEQEQTPGLEDSVKEE